MLRGGGEAWDDLPTWDAASGWGPRGVSQGGGGRAHRGRGHSSRKPSISNNDAAAAVPSSPAEDRGGSEVEPPPPLVTMNIALRDLCERIRDRLGDLQGESWASLSLFRVVKKN